MLVQEEVSRLTNAIASSLKKKCKTDDDEEIELIEKIRINLVKKYMQNADKTLSVLKTQLRELMEIPSHVLLPEDLPQHIQYTMEEEKEMDKVLNELFLRQKRVKALNVELLQELKMLQDIIPDLNRKVENLEGQMAMQLKKEKDLQMMEPVVEEIVENTLSLVQTGETVWKDQF